MGKKISPAFLFYYKDFFGDGKVKAMSKEERYDYLSLLSCQWEDGKIPSDMDSLANMTDNSLEEFEKKWNRIGRCFKPGDEPDTLQNERMKELRAGYIELHKKRSQGGKESAESQWGNGNSRGKKRSQMMAEARKKGTHTPEEWDEMKAFFEGFCVKCRHQIGISAVQKDHIIPIYQGGSDAISNLQPFCASCNCKKRGDSKDYRLEFCESIGKEMPVKWLLNAQEMPNKTPGSLHPSPSPLPFSSSSPDAFPEGGEEAPPCPHQEILEEYNRILGTKGLPRIDLEDWNGDDRGNLERIWRKHPKTRDLLWWRKLFTKIRDRMPFLMGKEKNWRADLPFIVGDKFKKILRGGYLEAPAKGRHPDDGGGPEARDGDPKEAKAFMAEMGLGNLGRCKEQTERRG